LVYDWLTCQTYHYAVNTLISNLSQSFHHRLHLFRRYLVREWYLHKDLIQEHFGHQYAQYCLIAAIALTIFMFSGKTLIKLIFSKRKPGETEPKAERYSDQYQLVVLSMWSMAE